MKLLGSVRAKKSPRVAAMAVAALAAVGVSVAAPAVLPADCQAQTRRAVPPTARYVAGNGQGFILDTSGSRALMRFERSTEVWVLRPTPAPRGDIIYRNDNGDQVLRVTPNGGVTLYTTATPQGSPASRVGEAQGLAGATLTGAQLVDYFMRQSYRASQAMGRLIVIDVDIQPGSEQVAADTVSAASDAIVRMARSSNLRGQVERVRRVVVSDQGRPGVSLIQGTLRIVIDADAGVAGRPSSARIVRVVGGEALNR
ncbi:MAG: DUF4908 domain-containing protein [Brevundimonas sp.]|mgnify:CR=1 FL=1|jgi:hypothetical protein|nr:MAG: DUF4908 domain-containing protein [Brevundimonas sp.]